jgi:Lar family restriction alleviation protein
MVKLPPEETLRGTDGPQTGLPAAREDEWSLSSCPHCGGDAAILGEFWQYDKEHYCVTCFDCGARIDADTPRKAMDKWNRRAPQVAQRAATAGGVAPTLSGAEGEIARLREALRDCLGWHDFADDLTKPIEVRAAYMRARAALGAP